MRRSSLRSAAAPAVRFVAVAGLVLAAAACSGDDGGTSPTAAPGTTTPSSPTPGGGGNATDAPPAPGTDAPPLPTDQAPTEPPVTEPPTTTTTEPPTTTTTLPRLVKKNAVVKVANAAGVPGAAGRLTEVFQQLGYPTGEATDAAGYEYRLERSKVYYKPEAQAAAESIARAMGVRARPMPTPIPIVLAQEALGDATIVVMLGEDLADGPVPGLQAYLD